MRVTEILEAHSSCREARLGPDDGVRGAHSQGPHPLLSGSRPPPPIFLRAPERCPEHGVACIARRGAPRLEPPPTEPGSPHLLRAAPSSPLRLQYQPRSGGTLPLGPPVDLGPCDPGRGAPKTSDPCSCNPGKGQQPGLCSLRKVGAVGGRGRGGGAAEEEEAGGAGGARPSRAQAPPPGSPPTAVPRGFHPDRNPAAAKCTLPPGPDPQPLDPDPDPDPDPDLNPNPDPDTDPDPHRTPTRTREPCLDLDSHPRR